MNNKKVLIITFATLLLLTTNAFILFMGIINRTPLLDKVGFSSYIWAHLKDLTFFKEILIFIGFFAVFYILYTIIKDLTVLIEKSNNTKEVTGEIASTTERIYRYKFKGKTYSTGNHLISYKYKKMPGRIKLFIDPFYPFVWGLKSGTTIKKEETKSKIISSIKKIIVLIVIIFIIIVY